MSKTYDSICRQMGELTIASKAGVATDEELVEHLGSLTAHSAAHILRLGYIIHTLEVKLGKRRRKSARQHNALSDYKRRDYYAMKQVQIGDKTYQFPQMAYGLPAERLP